MRRFLCFGLKKERGCLCSGLPWLPAQVRLGAGSPADRMIHRAGDVFGVAVSKTYLIRILGYIRVRFFNVSQQNALMTYGVCMWGAWTSPGSWKSCHAACCWEWEMRTRRTITTFPGLHSHSGVVIGPQQACYVPPEQYRACCGRYLALNIIELAFLSLRSWRIATQVWECVFGSNLQVNVWWKWPVHTTGD